jgi:predicted nucleic acid-binding protein
MPDMVRAVALNGRGRSADRGATALANEMPLFTPNPDDFDHLEAVGLQVHTV